MILQIPLSCTWQTLRDKFRDIGEVKFAEIRGNDVGVVRFFKDKDAELAISEYPFLIYRVCGKSNVVFVFEF